MKRREAVKGIILFSLGTGMLYSCLDPYEAVRDLDLDFIRPDKAQLDIIDSISKIVVPLQMIPVLSNHTALPFVVKMVEDNFKVKERDEFISAYQNWDAEIEKMEQKSYSLMTKEEKIDLLTRFNDDEVILPEKLQNFYDAIKSLNVKYLTTTEYYYRKVNYYEMAPGRFYGDVSLADLQNVNNL